MPFQAAPGIASVVLNYNQLGVDMVNVMHFRKDVGSWTQGALDTMAQQMGDLWTAEIMTELSDILTLESVVATNLTNPTGPQSIYTVGAVGQNGSPALPTMLAFCIAFNTGLLGRSYRGRIFIPGLCENMVLGNDVDVGYAVGLQNGVVNVMASLVISVEASLVVLSRVTDGEERPVGIGTVVETIGYNDRKVDSQRRRKK